MNIYNPTRKQEMFHDMREPNALLWGSRGTGKSTGLRWDAHLKAGTTAGLNYLFVRRSYAELSKSHLIYLDKEVTQLEARFDRPSTRIRYPNGSNGWYHSVYDSSDLLQLSKLEVDILYIDECATFEWDLIEQLKYATRADQLRCATSPLGVSATDCYKHFVGRSITPKEDPDYNPAEWNAVHVGLGENPHIDEARYTDRLQGLSPNVKRAWLEGEWNG